MQNDRNNIFSVDWFSYKVCTAYAENESFVPGCFKIGLFYLVKFNTSSKKYIFVFQVFNTQS